MPEIASSVNFLYLGDTNDKIICPTITPNTIFPICSFFILLLYVLSKLTFSVPVPLTEALNLLIPLLLLKVKLGRRERANKEDRKGRAGTFDRI
jgi:hypothetical protein